MKHIPVMLQESLDLFKDKKIYRFFDGTLGAGGFARAILEQHPEIEIYYGCDQDEEAIEIARKNLEEFEGKVEYIHSNFSKISEIMHGRSIKRIDGFFLILESHQCSLMSKKEDLVL